MKIAVSGSVGIGKSTLAKQLARFLRLPCIEENYETFFEKKDKFHSPPEQLVRIFHQVLELKRSREIDYGSFVTDRCPIDLLNLWLKKGLCLREEDTQAFYQKCKSYASEYHFVIFPPWGEIPLKQPDNPKGYQQRVLNTWIQLDSYSTILGIARLWLGDKKIIQIPAEKLDQEQRLNFVINRIKVCADENQMRKDELVTMSDMGDNQELLKLIPPDVNVVVEIGCQEGKLGKRYKRRNPAGKYIGIESDLTAAGMASEVLDQVITAELAALTLENNQVNWGTVDCLVIHGHLLNDTEPWVDMQRLAKVVSDNCIVLMTFNNAQHWSGIIRLLLECSRRDVDDSSLVEYQAAFTLGHIRNLFKHTGLKVLDIFGGGGNGVEYRQFLNAARDLMVVYDIDAEVFTKKCAYKQFIVRATKIVPKNRLLIQSVTLKPVAACNDKRIHEPGIFLRSVPGVRVVSSEVTVQIIDGTTDGSKVLVWQRPILKKPDSFMILRRLIRSGYLIIVEFDDDPRRWQEIVDNDFLTFRGVHGIQTSTDTLADYLRKYNPEVAVFPNQIMELPSERMHSNNGIVRLFFGALNREPDWKPLMPALNRALHEFDERIHVTVVHDRSFFNALLTSYKVFEPTCNYQRYLQILRSCDIGLLPLEANEFNIYKSDLKFIEHAACHVVALASPTVYEHSIVDGQTGMVFRSESEFEEKIRFLINNADVRLKISENAYHWLLKHRLLAQHYRERYEWYQIMLGKLPRLNEELKERMPELFTD